MVSTRAFPRDSTNSTAGSALASKSRRALVRAQSSGSLSPDPALSEEEGERMRRLIVLVSPVLLAASSVNCTNSPGDSVPLSPSAFVEDATVSSMSGAGKGKKNPTTSSLTLVMVSDINDDRNLESGQRHVLPERRRRIWGRPPMDASRDVVIDHMGVRRSRLHRRVDCVCRQEVRHARVVELHCIQIAGNNVRHNSREQSERPRRFAPRPLDWIRLLLRPALL